MSFILPLILLVTVTADNVLSQKFSLREPCKPYGAYKKIAHCVMPAELETAISSSCPREDYQQGFGIQTASSSAMCETQTINLQCESNSQCPNGYNCAPAKGSASKLCCKKKDWHTASAPTSPTSSPACPTMTIDVQCETDTQCPLGFNCPAALHKGDERLCCQMNKPQSSSSSSSQSVSQSCSGGPVLDIECDTDIQCPIEYFCANPQKAGDPRHCACKATQGQQSSNTAASSSNAPAASCMAGSVIDIECDSDLQCPPQLYCPLGTSAKDPRQCCKKPASAAASSQPQNNPPPPPPVAAVCMPGSAIDIDCDSDSQCPPQFYCPPATSAKDPRQCCKKPASSAISSPQSQPACAAGSSLDIECDSDLQCPVPYHCPPAASPNGVRECCLKLNTTKRSFGSQRSSFFNSHSSNKWSSSARRARSLWDTSSKNTIWTSIKGTCGQCLIDARCRTRKPEYGCSASLDVQKAPCSTASPDNLNACSVTNDVCQAMPKSLGRLMTTAEAKQAVDKFQASTITRNLNSRKRALQWETVENLFVNPRASRMRALSVATYLKRLPMLNCVKTNTMCQCCCQPSVPHNGVCYDLSKPTSG